MCIANELKTLAIVILDDGADSGVELAGPHTANSIGTTQDYDPTFLNFAEGFGGGSEYFPFWRLPLWPFSSNRLFAQEEK